MFIPPGLLHFQNAADTPQGILAGQAANQIAHLA